MPRAAPPDCRGVRQRPGRRRIRRPEGESSLPAPLSRSGRGRSERRGLRSSEHRSHIDRAGAAHSGARGRLLQAGRPGSRVRRSRPSAHEVFSGIGANCLAVSSSNRTRPSCSIQACAGDLRQRQSLPTPCPHASGLLGLRYLPSSVRVMCTGSCAAHQHGFDVLPGSVWSANARERERLAFPLSSSLLG